jgi:CcmD family protein
MKNLESLMAAYLLVWGILFVYHLSVGRRLARLQDDVKRLKEVLKDDLAEGVATAKPHPLPNLMMSLGITGMFVGGLVGFLLRPAVPILGQLPFKTVILRGSDLTGMDELLLGAARTSFNYLVAGVLVGAFVGALAGYSLSSRSQPDRPQAD